MEERNQHRPNFIDQEILSSVVNLLKLCDYSLDFGYQFVYLTALCYDANIDINGICLTVFIRKHKGRINK